MEACTWVACPCLSVSPSPDVDGNHRPRANASLDSSRPPATPRTLIVARGRRSKSLRTSNPLFEKSPFAVTPFPLWVCSRTFLSARSYRTRSLPQILTIAVYMNRRELLVSTKVKITLFLVSHNDCISELLETSDL